MSSQDFWILISKYRYYIILIIFILLIISILFGLFNKENKIEGLNNLIKNNSKDICNMQMFENFDNKNIYLRYDKNVSGKTESNYLTVSPKSFCDNYSSKSNDCLFNLAILQTQKSIFSVFRLIKNIQGLKYRLTSMAPLDKLNYVNNLNMNFFSGFGSNYVCFDNSPKNDFMFFDLEENTKNQYRIKFKVPKQISNGNSSNQKQIIQYEDYYVTICNNVKDICMQGNEQNIRLCLTKNPQQSIYFNIEICHDQEEEEMETNVAICNEIESLYSLNETEINKLTEENDDIIGLEENLLNGHEKFMLI